MSAATAQVLWIVALGALLAAWWWQLRRARADADGVTRGHVFLVFVLVGALGAGGAFAWGARVAEEGLARVKQDVDRPARRDEPPVPARARLFLRYVQLFFDPDLTASIGYSPTASLQLPRDYALEEAGRSADVVELQAIGPRGLSIHPAAADQSTRILVHVHSLTAGEEEAVAAARSALIDRRGRCRAPEEVPAPIETSTDPLAYVVVLCGREPGTSTYTPRAAMVFERDLPPNRSAPVDTPVRVRPYVWRGNGFRPHHVQLAAGTLLQIGALGDALPGMNVWEIPAPAGRSGLLFPPRNLLSPCEKWLENNASQESGFFYPDLGMVKPGTATAGEDSFACVLPFTPPFALEVRRLLPDTAGVRTRSLWSSLFLVGPALLLLALIFAQRPSLREPTHFARAVGFAAVSASLAGLLTFRLLWAHRLDMLREYQAVGVRVIANQVLVVLVGAALAGTAASLWWLSLRPRGRTLPALAVGAAAWAAFLALGWIAVTPDASFPPAGGRALAQLLFSVALATAVTWWPWLWRTVPQAVERARPARLAWASPGWLVAVVGLLGVAVAATGGRALAPLSVPAKLFPAWLFPPLFYLALRGSLGAKGFARLPLAVAGVAALLALGALFRQDTGVTTAVAATGGLLALIAAAHDHVHSELDIKLVDNYGNQYAPLLVAEGLFLCAAAAALGVWGASGLLHDWRAPVDARFPQTFTRAGLHLAGAAAALFGGLAYAVYRRWRVQRRARPWAQALPWGALAAILLVAWFARGPAVDAAMTSRGETGERVGAILDPSFALLRDERSFAKGLTAWRETAVPASPEAADQLVSGGQGYFGAQVLDPGVLLSIENDYLPVLLLRETGASGVARLAVWSLVIFLGVAFIGAGRFPEGTPPLRLRRVMGVLVAVLCVYQPLGSLGALPFTGVSWPGLGIDSPTDLWIVVAILLFAAVWVERPVVDKLQDELRRADAVVRRGRAHRRIAPLLALGATALAAAGALLVLRAGAFAIHPRELVQSVPGPNGATVIRFNPPFEGIESVFDYMYRMQCTERSGPVDKIDHLPPPLLAEPGGERSLVRYHRAFGEAWSAEQAPVLAELRAFAESNGDKGCAASRRPLRLGHWTVQRGGEGGRECRLQFKYGWPEYRLTYALPDPPEARVVQTCSVEVPEQILQTFRYPLRRPYANARIRLVSRAMGKPRDDVGELISGNVIIRLRAGAPQLALGEETAGAFTAGGVTLPNDVHVAIGTGGVTVRRPSPVASPDPPRVLSVTQAARVHSLEPELARWDTRLLDPGGQPATLDALAVIVTGGSAGRTVWMFRPASSWPDEPGAPVVNPLLADNVSTVLGTRRRQYVYGGLLPELGWVNPSLPERSLGLDGWTAVGVGRYERAAGSSAGFDLPSPHARFAEAYCGTLDPPVPAATGADVDAAFTRVCAPSPLDGVLECRVSLQPELQIRLRHLLELSSQRPELFTARKGFLPAVASSFALLRGDTGEIVAQGTFTPGRESAAYAPATPSLEKYLIDVREDRDPATGKPGEHGEAGAEKADWSQAIAVGSTMKPLLGRAFERAAPDAARALQLQATKPAAGCLPLLGHCPPTATVWEHADGQVADLSSFISRSYNWFQAALGLIGPAFPDGRVAFHGEEPVPPPLSLRLDGYPEDQPLVMTYNDRPVILSRSVDVDALRTTPMWKQFEALLGRPLCTGKSKEECARDGDRYDLCAARSLPVEAAGRDLRHLVAAGPATFDFADSGRANDRPYMKEYFQFLRGSGKHPLASVVQLADSFNRLFYDPSSDPRYHLAASWFPAPPVGRTPVACADVVGPSVADGLCDALTPGGTAERLRTRLDDPGLILYGAKTGTVDSLGDLVARGAGEACRRFNINHTTPDGGTQYHLDCGDASRNDLNDSLLVIAFAVRREGGEVVPLTLALRYQRVGSFPGGGYAVDTADAFLDVILDYFGAAL